MKVGSFAWLVALAFALAGSGCSCGGSNLPPEDSGTDSGAIDGSMMGDGGGVDGGSVDGGSVDGGGLDADGVDGGGVDGGGPDGGPECTTPTDCQTTYGAPPCGSWECNSGRCEVNCPSCTGDADRDGYGMGAGCAGPDCDDADDTVGSAAARACYSGAAGTAGVGACQAGTETCTAGVWAPCTGEVTPSGEACNGQDDNCEGMVDEGLGRVTCGIGACATTVAACVAGTLSTCTPGTPASNDSTCNGVDDDCDGAVDEDCPTCVTVSPGGDDTAAAADGNTTPFATIQAAVNWAAAAASRPRQVCVASGPGCGATRTYTGAVDMANGISVYGRYQSTAWTRCGNSVTTIRPGRGTGVVFADTITTTTVLDGFRIERHNSATTSGVTIDGATNAVLSDLLIDNTPSVTNSYGINLVNGAEALITGCSVYAGNGTNQSIGLRSVGSLPTLRDNCDSIDVNGRCDDYCGNGTLPAFRGRFVPGTGNTFAILLQDSPGAVVEQNAICGNDAERGAGVRVLGDATGTIIRANLINAWGGEQDSHGVWMTDCGGAAPWIVDNFMIAAAGDSPSTRVDGVRSVGDCHPVVDGNVRITGGGEGGTVGATGVHCGLAAGVTSRCVVLGNQLIEGSSFGFPPTSIGVMCEDGACNRVASNTITGRAGVNTWGVWLENTGAFVDSNLITGGCGTSSAVGLYARDAWARVQNNVISGGTCAGSSVGGREFIGVHAVAAAGRNELVVHSNTIDGAGMAAGCQSAAVAMNVTAMAPAGAEGVFRNNILRAGMCSVAYGLWEQVAGADPRIVENNDFDPFRMPSALYRDESSTDVTTVAAVNALADTTAAGNISVDPMFVGYPLNVHLGGTSMCIDAGTTAGAPRTDYEGDARDASPDIGADEFI